MAEFRRNKKTGILEAYKNDKKVGNIVTMGDDVNGKQKSNKHTASK